MTKKDHILFIDATPDNKHPLPMIKAIAEGYGYDFSSRESYSESQILKDIENYERPIDILYIAAHGDEKGIEFQDHGGGTVGDIDWETLADTICLAGGLEEKSTIYLACCRGGYKNMALTLFGVCDTVCTVAGVACDLDLPTEALIFHTFLDNYRKNSDAKKTEQAIRVGCDHEFNIYKRVDHELDITLYKKYVLQYEIPEDVVEPED